MVCFLWMCHLFSVVLKCWQFARVCFCYGVFLGACVVCINCSLLWGWAGVEFFGLELVVIVVRCNVGLSVVGGHNVVLWWCFLYVFVIEMELRLLVGVA